MLVSIYDLKHGCPELIDVCDRGIKPRTSMNVKFMEDKSKVIYIYIKSYYVCGVNVCGSNVLIQKDECKQVLLTYEIIT